MQAPADTWCLRIQYEAVDDHSTHVLLSLMYTAPAIFGCGIGRSVCISCLLL
jgi:hypothetical protein